MKKYIISTDTTCDLPEEYLMEHRISVMSLSYTIDGETYDRDHGLPEKDFYSKVRNGSLPTTSQVNPESAKKIFTYLMEKRDADILHIAFSSGLSGSYNSTRVAAEELAEKYPEHKIIIIDSFCASLGEGLLVHQAFQNLESGMDLEENAKWVEENKLKIVHNFTVDDLNHLYRGGRVSKTTAVFGTMIHIKPILHVDDAGLLFPVDKVRGRKKSLIALVDAMEKQMGTSKDKNDIVFISHGDCLEDAQYVAELIEARFGIVNFLINYIGPTIGAHTGAGAVALFYVGDVR
ncbi:DegV family protein [Lachnospiraceae bacterium ZAX-1]